jgi:hypothetical protein
MRSRNPYFPELHLSRWFAERGDVPPIYCLENSGERLPSGCKGTREVHCS